MSTKKITPGIKTSELWVVAICVADYLAQRFDIYGRAMSVADQVRQVADRLHGIDPGADPGALYLLAGVYIVARTALKLRER